MTAPHPAPDTSPDVAAELAHEQTHVDRVYAELEKASLRAADVEADGLARGRTDRTGDVRDEEMTGLFERDALVYAAARRRSMIEKQYEGLVFGRLDLGTEQSTAEEREVRYIGRLGVRDDDYEPLVVDWRAPAASAFYRATPVDPMGVVRRRVLRCKGATVVGAEDDLMVPEAPDDIVVLGDGALIAALTRSRGRQMRDIVATIQRHQDEAIRAPSRGITEISGGPGTGKTVVALHRAAYLLYSERRRFENGGILVVGPSAAYTAYIERVLPSLGEESVALRAMGDLVEGMTATRLDSPEVAAIKGSLRIRRLLSRLTSRPPQGAPREFRAFVGGHAVRLDEHVLRRVRSDVLRNHQHNVGTDAARTGLAEAAWRSVRQGERDAFLDAFDGSRDVDEFMASWWRQIDPRELLLGLADTDHVYAVARGVLDHEEGAALAWSYREALELGSWSVADAALVDDLVARLAPVQAAEREDVGFYDIEELDDLSAVRRAGRPGRDRPPRRGRPAGRGRDAGRCAGAAAHGPHRPAVGVRPRPRRRGPGPVADAVADALASRPGCLVDGRRRCRAGVVVRPRRGRPGARGGLCRAAAAGVPHGHQLPQRARDLRPRARRHPPAWSPTPTSRMPCARRASTRSTASSTGRWRRRRRMPWTSCSGRSRARSPSSARAAGPSGSPASTVSATAGCRSSTRSRPRAWSGTRRSSSTPTASSTSPPAGCGCSTSC